MQNREQQQLSQTPASLSLTIVADEEEIPASPLQNPQITTSSRFHQIASFLKRALSRIYTAITNTANQILIFIGARESSQNDVPVQPEPISALTYHNNETLISQTPVAEIEPANLIVLDNYAFAIDELVQHYEHEALHHAFRNPHLVKKRVNQEFSKQALQKMKEHPALQKYIIALEDHLAHQDLINFHPQTLLALIQMLNNINKASDADAYNQARDSFLAHVDTLSKQKQQQLESFIISTPSTFGDGLGFQRLAFIDAIKSECILTLQEFSWQFVVTQRPSALVLVPWEVHRMARRAGLAISPPAEALHTDILETSAADARAIVSMHALEEAARLANIEREQEASEEKSDDSDLDLELDEDMDFDLALGFGSNNQPSRTGILFLQDILRLSQIRALSGLNQRTPVSAPLGNQISALSQLSDLGRELRARLDPMLMLNLPLARGTLATLIVIAEVRRDIQRQMQSSNTTAFLQMLMLSTIIVEVIDPSPVPQASQESKIDFEGEYQRFHQSLFHAHERSPRISYHRPSVVQVLIPGAGHETAHGEVREEKPTDQLPRRRSRSI